MNILLKKYNISYFTLLIVSNFKIQNKSIVFIHYKNMKY